MITEDVLIAVAVFGGFWFIIKLFLDHLTRRKLIESGNIDQNIRYLYFNQAEPQAPSSLKWGLVLVALGLAIVIGQLLPYPWERGEIIFSLMLLFAGIALLINYAIVSARQKVERERRLREGQQSQNT
jgi:hypothetical protein